MSELKVRNSARESWQIIESQRTKVRKAPCWKWAAHRGAYIEGLPENTIPTLIRAKERGFGYSECDIQVSSDNILVVSHDATISGKDANGNSVTLTIKESTAEAVCALVKAAKPRFGYIRPCTLDEYLNAAYYIGIDVIIHCGEANTEEIGKQVALSVIANGMQGRVIYMPGSMKGANGIVSVDKHAAIEFCYLTEFAIPEDWSSYTELLSKCDYVGFDFSANLPPTDEAVTAIRANGFGISFWSVGSGNYTACLDVKPRALTLADDTADFHAWEKEYLDSVKLW